MPRSVRAFRATTSTSTSRNGSASPARCNGRSRDSTVISLDALFARFDAERSEIFLEAPVFSTNGAAAMNNVDVRRCSDRRRRTRIVYGVFNDVDIRSEARFDELRTDFTHITLDGSHEFSDTLRLHALVGYSRGRSRQPRPDDVAVRSRRRRRLQLRLPRQQPLAGDHVRQRQCHQPGRPGRCRRSACARRAP